MFNNFIDQCRILIDGTDGRHRVRSIKELYLMHRNNLGLKCSHNCLGTLTVVGILLDISSHTDLQVYDMSLETQ